MVRWRISGGALVLAAVLGAGLLHGCRGTARSDAPESQAFTSVADEVVVQTQAAVERAVPTIVRATGTFVPDESSEVTPQVSGQVVETPVNVGDIVKAGQLLVRLDDRNARLLLQQAEASLLQAEAQAQRAQAEVRRNADLVGSGDISRSTFEQLTTQVAVAEATVAQARAQLASAQKAVDDTGIPAPFSGHVSARPIAVGEYVTTSSKVITVVRITPIKLELRVPEPAAATLRRGMAVSAEVPAHPEAAFMGTVSALNVMVDPASRSMAIEVTFPNGDGRLTPGMFGSAEVQLPAAERGVFVPSSAVVPLANGQSSGVFVVEGNVARVRVVQLGERHGDDVRILSGLEPGVIVVTSHGDQLIDGARVQAEPTATPLSGAVLVP